MLAFGDQIAQANSAGRGTRIGNRARQCDQRSWSDLARARFLERAVAPEREEVVTRRHPDRSPGGETDLEDPIGRSLVPAGDAVVPDLERLGVSSSTQSESTEPRDQQATTASHCSSEDSMDFANAAPPSIRVSHQTSSPAASSAAASRLACFRSVRA
jgi:hypothetical protein